MLKKINKIDNKIINFIERNFHNKKVDIFMKIITFLGDYGLIWLSVILYLILNNYNQQAKATIIALIATIFSNELVLKNCFKRARPAHKNKYDNMVINVPKSFSFPSGHTATAFSVVATTYTLCDKPIFIISLVSATLIAFSRVYLRVHYLSDVIAGALLGSTISHIVITLI